MADIILDVWLYGALACYGGRAENGSFANLHAHLPEGSTMADLLAYLKMPAEERGITFINGRLSAMPGLKPDLGHILKNGDRVGFFPAEEPRSGFPGPSATPAALCLRGDHSCRRSRRSQAWPESCLES